MPMNAIYVHGLGSGAATSGLSTIARILSQYQWHAVEVNEKTNAHRSFRKNLRAAVFAAETFGCTRKEYNSIMGKISYLSMLLNEDRGCIYKYKAIMSKVMIKK